MAAQFDAVAELQGTFKVLFEKRNWMLALPILIGQVVAGIVIVVALFVALGPTILALITGGAGAMSGMSDPNQIKALAAGLIGFGGLVFVIGFVIAAILIGLSQAWAVAAADPVWQGREPDLGGGLNKAMSKLGAVVVAGIITFLLAIIPSLLIIAFGLGILLLIVLGFFLMYVMPYIVIGNEGGAGAIGASFRLARANTGPTVALFLGLIVIAVISAIVHWIFGHIPFLGWIVSLAVGALVSAYATLAIVRFYRLLTGGATASTPATTA